MSLYFIRVHQPFYHDCLNKLCPNSVWKVDIFRGIDTPRYFTSHYFSPYRDSTFIFFPCSLFSPCDEVTGRPQEFLSVASLQMNYYSPPEWWTRSTAVTLVKNLVMESKWRWVSVTFRTKRKKFCHTNPSDPSDTLNISSPKIVTDNLT